MDLAAIQRRLEIEQLYTTYAHCLDDMALRRANIYEPQRYRHLISAMHIATAEGNALDAVANFLVVRTMQDGAMTLFAAGRYIDRVVRSDTGWKFAGKQVILDSRQIDTLLALPL